MSRRRRVLLVAAALIVAGLLAFPLREAIYEMIVIPAAYIAWNLDLLYRMFSQGIWWWALIVLVLFMLAFSLAPETTDRRREPPKPRPPQGPVEALAIWLQRAQKGVYFRWLVANRLGKLGYQILLHRESGRPRSVFAPLLGMDWEPPKAVQNYLETGLHRSFADFPNTGRFAAHQHSPLDLPVDEAVEFLESQVENHRPEDPRRQG